MVSNAIVNVDRFLRDHDDHIRTNTAIARRLAAQSIRRERKSSQRGLWMWKGWKRK